MSINRRDLMAGAALTGAACALPLSAAPARAQDAAARGQAPAYHRFALGDIVVTALSDGYIPLDAGAFPEVSQEEFADAMAAAFRSPDGYPAPVNAYVVATPQRTILIDAGATRQMAPSLGNLPDNLAAAGVAAEEIDTVLVTHLHPDHIGALTEGGAASLPNAQMILHAEEAAFWTDPATRSAFPEGLRGMVDAAAATVAAYEGRTSLIESDTEVAPGIEAVFLPGHTPGHTGFRITSGEASLLVWGDIVHAAPLQMPNPRVFIGFDVDEARAVETRLAILDEVAADRTLVAGMHMPFPGFGHVARAGDGYAFVRTPWQYL